MEKIPQTENQQEKWSQLADKLEKAQADKNKGMGVSCVRQIAQYIRMGMIKEAQTFAHTDHDKIRNYPDLKEIIINELFADQDEHPWSIEERWSKDES